MKCHQKPIGNSDDWITPKSLIEKLGRFALDPCQSKTQPWPCALMGYTQNGLNKEWFDTVWLNPPFNRYERYKWMKKMSEHRNGIMLIPAACETKAFYDYVWPIADALCFLKGRLHFHYPDGTRAKANCGCTLCLVAYGEESKTNLLKSGLGKTLVITGGAR